MSSEQEEPRKPGPPPPDLRKPVVPPPPPSMGLAPAGMPPVNVKVKAGSDESDPEETGTAGDDGSAIPLGTRVLAVVIDIAIGVGLYIAVVILSNLPLMGLMGNLAWPVYLAFMLTRDGLPFLKGQSPGKAAMKIKAVTVSGESLSGNWKPVLIRNGVLLIPVFALVELVVLLTREDKSDQGIRLGDEWAGTRVVRADPPEPAGKAPEA